MSKLPKSVDFPDTWKQIHDSLLSTANQMQTRSNRYYKAGDREAASKCHLKANKCLTIIHELKAAKLV